MSYKISICSSITIRSIIEPRGLNIKYNIINFQHNFLPVKKQNVENFFLHYSSVNTLLQLRKKK